MDKKTIGYVLSVTGFVNLLVLNGGLSYNPIPFLTFLVSFCFGMFLLYKEDTPVRHLWESIMKTKKGEHTYNYERPMSTERTPSTEMQSGTEIQPNTENPSSIGLQSNYEVPRHKSVYEPKENVNIVALLAVAVSVISVFLPWFAYSTSAKSDTFNMDMESAVNISGKSLDYPILGVFIILLGGFLAYKNFKWSFFAGFFNFMASLGYIFGWIGMGNLGGLGIGDVDINYSFGDASVSASFDPTLGLYLFCISSIVFVLFTLKYLKSK